MKVCKWFIITGLLLMLSGQAWADSFQYVLPGPIKIDGVLKRIVMIGGETTGWYIQFKETLVIINNREAPIPKGFGIIGSDRNTVTIDKIEIDYCCPEKLKMLEGKEVKIGGFLKWKRGVERGIYWYVFTGYVDEVK